MSGKVARALDELRHLKGVLDRELPERHRLRQACDDALSTGDPFGLAQFGVVLSGFLKTASAERDRVLAALPQHGQAR